MAINIELLQNKLKENKKTNLEHFENLIIIYLGVEEKEYFEKLRDAQGKVLKDRDGNEMREEIISGYTYTFSELGTSRIVKVVLKNKIDIRLLKLFFCSGDGYNIKQSSMLFLKENCELKLYEQ